MTLNAARSTTLAPQRAEDFLKQVEADSAQIDVAWPQESRFHYQLLNLPPVLVVKASMRQQARFFVYGIPSAMNDEPNTHWQEVDSDLESIEHPAPTSRLSLYPLHRGPTQNPRFLAKFSFSGCAGSSGVAYDAEEWDIKDGAAKEIIKQEGAFGMDSLDAGSLPTSPFPIIGELQTKGPLITLPYCWFSAIDWWDNPSLCALDTYDLSGDEVIFQSRKYNRPELVPIAKAFEYAGKHDYLALRAYCASEVVARRLLRQVPDLSAADNPTVKRIGRQKDSVEIGESGHFVVEERASGWVISSFRE